jgi:hypothetical protein
MKSVDLYAQVRFAVQIEGVSRREAARRFGIDPRTGQQTVALPDPAHATGGDLEAAKHQLLGDPHCAVTGMRQGRH